MAGYRTSEAFVHYKGANGDATTVQHLLFAQGCCMAAADCWRWRSGDGASRTDMFVAQAQWHLEQAAATLAVHMGD